MNRRRRDLLSAGTLTTVENRSSRTVLTNTVDEVEPSQTDTSSSVEIGVVSTGRSGWLTLTDVLVKDVTGSTTLGRVSVADLSVPGGAWGTGCASVDTLLEDADVARAGDSVEEGVGGTVGDGDVGGNTPVVRTHLVASLADAAETVKVRVRRTVGDLDTPSPMELCASNTDTSLD